MQVGPVYGRKTMTALLASQGLRVSQVRVGESLRRTNPPYHHQRMNSTAKQLNPVPYSAEYFGHKVHIDQNEKLVMVMYGVTHVCACVQEMGTVVRLCHLLPCQSRTILRFMKTFLSNNHHSSITYFIIPGDQCYYYTKYCNVCVY